MITTTLNHATVPRSGTRDVRPVAPTTYVLRARSIGPSRAERTLGSVTVTADYPPISVELVVTGIQCFQQEDTNVVWPFDTEDDEPYVLVAALNTPSVTISGFPPEISLELPRPRVIKVGPWEDVDDEGRIYGAPPNVIWDAASGSLASPSDAIFIAALVEWDSSDPEMVRGLVEGQMIAEAAVLHVTSIGSRVDFTRRMVDAMSSAVGLAISPIGSGGVIDPDDRIGPAQELPLTRQDFERVFAGGTSTFSLSFRGDDADYRVYFALRAA